MTTNQTIILVTSIVCATFFASFALYNFLHRNYLLTPTDYIKGQELQIGIYDQYTFCLRSVMKESGKQGKPCSAEEAAKICSKFNQPIKK